MWAENSTLSTARAGHYSGVGAPHRSRSQRDLHMMCLRRCRTQVCSSEGTNFKGRQNERYIGILQACAGPSEGLPPTAPLKRDAQLARRKATLARPGWKCDFCAPLSVARLSSVVLLGCHGPKVTQKECSNFTPALDPARISASLQATTTLINLLRGRSKQVPSDPRQRLVSDRP